MPFADHVSIVYLDIADSYGLLDPMVDDAEFWLGHSLPPELASRRGYMRVNRIEVKRMEDEMIEAIMPKENVSLAGFHRKLKDMAEFASVFGDEHPSDFKKNLKEYLEEPTDTGEI